MSSTITQTEEQETVQKRLVAGENHQILRKRRETFTRSASIEKLKKFNNYICSQHYYIVPTLVLWLKTSHTLLTANAEKFMNYVKAMVLICAIREFIQFKLKTLDSETKKHAFHQLSTKDLMPIVNIFVFRIQRSFALLYEHLKYVCLVTSVYFGICLVFAQLLGCTIFMFVKIPPIGFLFLLVCVLIISKLVILVMYQKVSSKKEKLPKIVQTISVEEKKRVRRQLTYIGKTISNVKLF